MRRMQSYQSLVPSILFLGVIHGCASPPRPNDGATDAAGNDTSPINHDSAVDAPAADHVQSDAGFVDVRTDTSTPVDVMVATDVTSEDVLGVDVSDAAVDTGSGCAAGEHLCAATCQVNTDPLYGCGAAGCAPCVIPNGTAVCASSACAVGACGVGHADCDGAADNGCEADTTASNTNCGACGHSCGTGQTCSAGVCGCTSASATSCGGSCYDLMSDPAHCGACGTACGTGQICTAGACQCAAATPTFCGSSSSCVNTTTDAANCGACGTHCLTGQSCIGSVCQLPYACTSVDGSSYPPIVNMAADLTGDGTRTLASVMAVFPNANMQRTPGVSLAIREADGTIHTAVFGDANNLAFDPTAPPLTPHTLFQAGSVSKPVSALAYLISEMADATRSVDIRPAVATLVTPPYAITPGDLLSHTAGTSVHGFLGYAPGLALPTIDQIVLGMSPANSLPVTFGSPGSWLYSGGGYMLWEDWLERTTHQPLATFVHDRLFVPAGATRSNYSHPPAATEHDVACGSDPVLLPGVCRFNYPEVAAAGLWTTPTELACITGYATTRRPDALARVTSRAVLISGYPQRQGLGWRHRPANGVDETAGHFYEHSGDNYGFCSTVAFFSDGRAIVSMDNSCAGVSLVVVRALCGRLGWTCSGPQLAAH